MAELQRLLQTASFRLAAAYAGLFAASTGLLFLVVYWIASTALWSPLRASIDAESEAPASEYLSAGQSQVVKLIDQQVTGRWNRTHFIFLGDKNGNRLAGNFAVSTHSTVPAARSSWVRCRSG